jgi:hypothetical protein
MDAGGRCAPCSSKDDGMSLVSLLLACGCVGWGWDGLGG